MVRTSQPGRSASAPPTGDGSAADPSPDDVTPEGPATAVRDERARERMAGAGAADPLPAAEPVRGAVEPGPTGGDGPAEADGDRPAPSPVVRRGVLAAFLLALVAAVVSGIVWNTGRAAESDRAAALEAARNAAVMLTSINHETAEQDVRRVVEDSTGDFGGLFAQNLDSYIALVKESKVSTQGEVTGAGIDSIDASTARAILAVKANVSNQSVPNGEARFYRMVTELEKKDGEWLVSRVEFVP